MNLIEAYIYCYRKAQANYFYHRGMMNFYWANPYKKIKESEQESYDHHKFQMNHIAKRLTRLGLPVLPRKAIK